MSFFSKSKMASVNVFESSPRFSDGKYLVELKEVKQVEGSDADFIAIETEVLASMATDQNAPAVGTEPAQVFKYPGDKNMGVANWMQFLCSTLDTTPDAQTDEEWRDLSEKITKENALEGTILELHVHTIITKKNTEYTKHVWKGEPDEATKKSYGL